MKEPATRREAATRKLLVAGEGDVDHAVRLFAQLVQPAREEIPLRIAGGERFRARIRRNIVDKERYLRTERTQRG